jgi:hypothetical protein
MGKSTSQQPSVPDPNLTARAQTAADLDMARAQSYMNNISETNPYGSVNYVKTGIQRVGATDIPVFRRDTVLNATQKGLLDQQNALKKQLNTLGINQATRIGNTLSAPINTSALTPDRQTAAQLGQLSQAATAPTLNNVSLDSVAAGGPLKNTATTQDANTTLANSGNIQGSVSLQNPAAALGTMRGSQQSVNLGDAATSFGAAGVLQNSVNMANAGTTFGNVGNVQTSLGNTDYAGQRTAVEDAIYSRLNPQLQQDRDALSTRLINQGFQVGSEGYNREMDAYNRQANDARMQAVLAGGQEQSRLAGLSQMAGQFANQAQQQTYDQAFGRGNFSNQAIAQNNAAALAQGQFANQAQQQGYSQLADRADFARDSIAQNNQSAIAGGQFFNQAQQQDYGQMRDRADYAMSAQNQSNQNALNSGQFANQAQQQQFNQNLGAGQFQQAGAAQNNAQQLALANLFNQAQGQAFNQASQRTMANNQTAQQQAQFNNANAQQNFANQQTRNDFNNSRMMDIYNTAMQNAAFNNNSRQQGLQEQLAVRNQGINEISALMSGGQVTVPQFAQYNPAQIARSPVAQSAYQSAALQNQQYQQQQSQQNALMGGLFGLGSSAIMFSDRRLKRDIADIGVRLASGLKLYAYRYAWEAKRRVGVMADEVAKVVPSAVGSVGGGATVDYDRVMGAA